MLSRRRSTFCLGLLAAALGFAVATGGGDAPIDSSVTLFLIGAAALIGGSQLFENDLSQSQKSIDRALGVLALCLPAYVVFQLIPLPVWLLQLVSPTRADVANALAGVMPAPRFAPLTISSPTTWMHLIRVTGYAIVFVIVRQIARRSTTSIWLAATPLIAVGSAEALWALSQPLAGVAVVTGSYYSKNHLAGLLEMILPLAVMCGVAVLHRGKERDSLAGSAALTACALFGGALAMFLAIGFSFSKMGYVSMLGSLLLIGMLTLNRVPAGWMKRTAVTGIFVAAVLAFVFITPAGVIEQFGTVVTDRTSEGRWPVWKDAAHLIAAYPLFGCGLGNFFPGLLRYQTAGVGLAWVNAHNDFLQLMSELGVMGFVIPAALVGFAFMRAFSVARRGASEETRFLALGCLGGLTAILIHSTADFNTYVLSNAVVLAWIVGISAALPDTLTPSRATSGSVVRWDIGPAFRYLVAGLALGVVVYSTTSAWFLNHAESHRLSERWLCGVGICQSQLETGNGTTALVDRLELLRRDPAGPYRWDDVGEAMQKAGRTDVARYAFSRSVVLGPNSPSTLLMAADFHFDVGEQPRALALISHALQVDTGEADNAIFGVLKYRQIPVSVALDSFSLDRRSSHGYFRALLKGDSVTDLQTLWSRLVVRGYATDVMTRECTEFMARKNDPKAAWQAWLTYVDGHGRDYPESNRVFNGDFESSLTGVSFDWNIDPAGAVDFDRDSTLSGMRSIRVQFDGTKNPGDLGLWQQTFLKAGRYRFRAYVKTRDISTDEGVGFRLKLDAASSALDLRVGNLRGSNGWTLLEQVFDVSGDGSFAVVSLVRRPSMKFDNLVGGTVWID